MESELKLAAAFITALTEPSCGVGPEGQILVSNPAWQTRFNGGQIQDNLLQLLEKHISGNNTAVSDGISQCYLRVNSGLEASAQIAVKDQYDELGKQHVVRFSRLALTKQSMTLVRLEEKENPALEPGNIPDAVFRTLSNNLPMLLSICNRNNEYIWVNEAYSRHFELVKKATNDKHVAKSRESDEAKAIDKLRQKCFETGQAQVEHITLENLGKPIVLEVTCLPVQVDGLVQYVVSAKRDITKQFQSQKSRAAAYDLLNDVLERMPVGFVATDDHYNILRTNDTACRLFEYTKDDLVGQNIDLLIPLEARLINSTFVENFLNTPRPSGETNPSIEISGLKRNGSVFPMLISVLPMALGEFPLFCVMIIDLTEMRGAEQRLVETQLRVQRMQKQEALGQLAGNIAHDFNNLLTIIYGYAEIVHADPNCLAPLKKIMTEIKSAVNRGAALTGQILAYAKHQALEVKPRDMHLILRENQSMIEAALTSKIKYQVDLSAESHIVEIDENQLMQVLLNLAVNARDAMASGGEFSVKTASISRDSDFFLFRSIEPKVDKYLCITVSDTGPGIPEQILPRIFDPYFSTKPRNKGTGLGLAVAYGIIKQHQGFIFCFSKPGHGATFEIILPACAPNTTAANPDAHENSMAMNPEDIRRTIILVVDDEAPIRNFLTARLESAGFQVHSASNGEEALDFIDAFEGKIDIILSDIMMPRMTGLEMAEIAQLLQPETMFIFMSGYSKELLDNDRPRGNFNLLVKPFRTEALFAEINRLITIKRDLFLSQNNT